MASDATVGFTNLPLTRACEVRGITPVERVQNKEGKTRFFRCLKNTTCSASNVTRRSQRKKKR